MRWTLPVPHSAEFTLGISCDSIFAGSAPFRHKLIANQTTKNKHSCILKIADIKRKSMWSDFLEPLSAVGASEVEQQKTADLTAFC